MKEPEERKMGNVNNGVYHHRKWLAVLIMFSMVAALFIPTNSKAQNAPSEIVPEGYIGIYDIADLYGIRNDLSANYILMKDIDMSEDTAEGGNWNLTGHGWTPIDGFEGTFDGNGHRITGMHIYGEMRQDVGLFGRINRGIISNLAITDIDINITFNSDYKRSYEIGGCIGVSNGKVNISNCYTTGNIMVTRIDDVFVGVGGFIGLMGGGSLNDVYNACNISINENINGSRLAMGGICSYSDCSFKNCYNIGVLNETDGGETFPIVSGEWADISNCYALSGTATSNSNCTILLPTQLKDKRALAGFDFNDVWEIDPYCSYPYPQLKGNRQIRIVSVDVVTKPSKTEYEQGDSLDLSGGAVRITYEDETTAEIPITDDMVSGYDMNMAGEQNVTVSYCDVCTTFPIIIKEVPLLGIFLNQSKVSLKRNESLQLSVNYMPANASDKTIEWSSSDSAIVKVDSNGIVTAKNKGTATITALSANGLMVQCQIEVLIPCAVITLNKTSASMKVGDTLQLTGQMLPLDTTDVMEWKTSDAAVADVSGGMVTAYKAGKAKVTAYVEGGVSVDCNITIKGSSKDINNNKDNKEKTAGIITSIKAKISYVKSKGSKSIKLKLNNLGSADGYQIQYSLKKNFKKSKEIKSKSSNVTIKKLKKNRRYYVRVRVYGKVDGNTYYGKWSTSKSARTKRK